MVTRKIQEASGALVESKTDRGVWPIRIITEGKGSSGVYTRELLESSKDVFASRAMFADHPTDASAPWSRSVLGIKGKLGPNIEYKVVDGVAGLYGEAKVTPEWDNFLAEYSDIIGVSIYASGEGAERDGEWYVESFDSNDPYVSCDFVVAAGRGGRVERVLEAAREIETSVSTENGSAPADADGNEREIRMNEADKAFIEALFAGVDEKIVALEGKLDAATALVESVRDSQPAMVEATELAGELATAVAEAKLGEKAVGRVLESVKGGSTVTDAVKHEKDIRDEILAEASKSVVDGYIVESAGSSKPRLSDFSGSKVGE